MTTTAAPIIRCSRCSARMRNHPERWNCTLRRGVVVGFLCPRCQTAEENAEAEVNEATLDYLPRELDGRYRQRPKGRP